MSRHQTWVLGMSRFCPRVCLQGSWNMQVWRNTPWFLQPLWVSSNSWPLPCNAQGREAHLGRGLVKLRLHEDVCECFWNEICVWICLKERANMLNCSPYHVRSTWINRHHTNSFESRDCSAYLVIITQFDSNKNLNDSLHSALLRGFVFLDDMCQCFTSQSVQEPKCEFPPAATGIDPIYWQDWTAAVSSHRDRWNVRWLAVKAWGNCCDWYCWWTKPCITGRNLW